ncbi:hypothetical protein QBC45DRAFT_452831 [Copromyces sp. CBS 386.78]|nr:hypothetical protein QBC45DRAFT_452831 [Copromyces sp. CBS 386.78]
MTIDLATPADDTAGTGTGGQSGGGANSTVGGNGYGAFNVTTSANGTVNGTYWQEWKIPDKAGRPLDADIIACAIITWLVALTFVALRFYTRTKLNSVLGPADWCLIPSLVFSAAVSASAIEQAVRGAGKHAWEVDTLQLPALERAAFYGIIFYSLSLAFTRISILLLYCRIFTYSWTKRAIQVGIVAVSAIGVWHIISVCTACVPLAAFWDWSYFMIPGKKVSTATPSMCGADLFIMALPMPALSRLKLPRRQKIALVGVFALGFFNNRQSADWFKYHKPFDSTYNMPTLMYWTSVEVNAAIACVCIMTLKPLIQRLFPRLLSTGSRYIHDHSLPWITPIHSTHSRSIHSRRGSSHSFAHARSRTHRRHRSNSTATSPMPEMKLGGEGALSSVDEYDNHDRRVYNELFRKEAALRISDLEARGIHGGGGGGGGSGSGTSTTSMQERENRGGSRELGRDRDQDSMSMTGTSLGGTVSHQHHDTPDGDDGGDSQLRAPPRAHLRLSIPVTKSIYVTQSARAIHPVQKTVSIVQGADIGQLRGLESCPWSTTGVQALSTGSFPSAESGPEVQ